MSSSRLGCLTINGIAAALLTALLLGGITIARGGAIYSPGDLNARPGEPLGGAASHSEIEECSACHSAFWSVQGMTSLCQECHTAVREEALTGAGIHGEFASTGDLRCQTCHTEHHGSDASLTIVDPETFPHAATGFSLASHQELDSRPFACADCHDPSTGYSTTDCLTCHRRLDLAFTDHHQADFGSDCVACHDGLETYGASFDHAAAAFPLEGKHQPLECTACHPGQTDLAELRSTPQDCSACHLEDDAHAGRFGASCGSCHSPTGWDQVDFDHNALAFPLAGEHADLDCEACHTDLTFAPMPHACFDCHADDDEHAGSYGTGCEQCHTPLGWERVTFDHSQLPFQLTGKHLLVDCQDCHAGYIYDPMPHACVDCHQEDDAHNGELGSDCALCHIPTGWDQITFDHSTTGFQLVGKHADVSCQDCHTDGRFKGLPTGCAGCHLDDDRHAGALGSNCARCHTPEGWGIITFDHSDTAFPLTGAHASQSCTNCHSGWSSNPPTSCSACHAEPDLHRGLFGLSCASCHNTSAWRPASFNGPHSFPMGHGGASTCSQCHPSGFTTWTCYTCHNSGEITAKHQEEGIGDFSDCLRCHPTGQEGDDGGGDEGDGD